MMGKVHGVLINFNWLFLEHNWFTSNLGGCTPSYILDTRAFGTYLFGGVIYLCKKDYKVMVFYM